LGESLIHGYILWDLSDNTHKFHQITNYTGYINILNYTNPTDIIIPEYLKEVHIQIVHSLDANKDTELQEYKNKFLASDSTIKLLSYNTIKIKNTINKQNPASETDKTLPNTYTTIDYKPDKIQEVFQKYYDNIQDTESLTNLNIIMKRYSEIYEEYTKTNVIKDNIKNIWKIISVNFDNFACYGLNNSIQIDKLDQFILINGLNGQGKSTIISVILYALFGQTTDSPVNMVRSGCDNLQSDIIVKLDDKYIRIVRKIIIKSRQLNDVQCYYKNINSTEPESDIWTPITTNKMDTEKWIQAHIGTIDDFIETSTFLQNKFNCMLEDKGAELKGHLCKLFNLDVFNELCKIARTNHNSIKTNIIFLKKIIVELDENKYKNMLNQTHDDIIIAVHMLNIISKYQKDIVNLTEELKELQYVIDLLDRNGVSLWLLKNMLDRLEDHMNCNLINFGEYRISFSVTETNVLIQISKNNQKYSVNGICGYEKFLIYLLMKIATRYVKDTSCGDILFIDEAISCFDKLNILRIKKIFDFIRMNYGRIFIISHVDIMEFVDGVIDIADCDGVSRMAG
jgi:DNA repair exonuclease SbcCD ATPase subunit